MTASVGAVLRTFEDSRGAFEQVLGGKLLEEHSHIPRSARHGVKNDNLRPCTEPPAEGSSDLSILNFQGFCQSDAHRLGKGAGDFQSESLLFISRQIRRQ